LKGDVSSARVVFAYSPSSPSPFSAASAASASAAAALPPAPVRDVAPAPTYYFFGECKCEFEMRPKRNGLQLFNLQLTLLAGCHTLEQVL
jgi:hypothetical protein